MGESYFDRKGDVKEKEIVRDQRWVGREEGVFY